MRRPMLATAALTLLPLGACSSGGTPTSEAMPMNSANAMMDMPRPDGRSFDVHSLPVYPGSKMADMKIMAHTAPDDMAYSFSSPAPLATVHDWFKQTLPARGYRLTEQGNGFAGTDSQGKMFQLELGDGPHGTTLGTITAAG